MEKEGVRRFLASGDQMLPNTPGGPGEAPGGRRGPREAPGGPGEAPRGPGLSQSNVQQMLLETLQNAPRGLSDVNSMLPGLSLSEN